MPEGNAQRRVMPLSLFSSDESEMWPDGRVVVEMREWKWLLVG